MALLGPVAAGVETLNSPQGSTVELNIKLPPAKSELAKPNFTDYRPLFYFLNLFFLYSAYWKSMVMI